jgi:hypothetical protein
LHVAHHSPNNVSASTACPCRTHPNTNMSSSLLCIPVTKGDTVVVVMDDDPEIVVVVVVVVGGYLTTYVSPDGRIS